MSTSFAIALAFDPPKPLAHAQWLASFRPSEHHRAHGITAKFVRKLAAKYLGWKVASLCSAEWALRGNPGIWHRANRGRDVFTTFLAADREIALPSLRKIEHDCQYRRTKGETASGFHLTSNFRDEMILSVFMSACYRSNG